MDEADSEPGQPTAVAPSGPASNSRKHLALAAALGSVALFLTLRLFVVRSAGSPPVAPTRASPVRSTPDLRRAAPTPRPPTPPTSQQAFATFVESWRLAWQTKNLGAYLDHYARTFGSQGRDYDAWAAQKREVFTDPAPIDLAIEQLRAQVRPEIVILTFVQTYRSGVYQDRGEKRLYLVDEGGDWKIFNEEWSELESP